MFQNNKVSFDVAHHRFKAKRRWRGFLVTFLVFIGEMKGLLSRQPPEEQPNKPDDFFFQPC